jgi:hypothetical protein
MYNTKLENEKKKDLENCGDKMKTWENVGLMYD